MLNCFYFIAGLFCVTKCESSYSGSIASSIVWAILVTKNSLLRRQIACMKMLKGTLLPGCFCSAMCVQSYAFFSWTGIVLEVWNWQKLNINNHQKMKPFVYHEWIKQFTLFICKILTFMSKKSEYISLFKVIVHFLEILAYFRLL